MPPDSSAYDRFRVVQGQADQPAPTPEPPLPEPTPPEPPHDDGPPFDPHRPPFRALGHDRGTFFFLTERGGQVLAFAGRDLSRDTVLMQLAPLGHWEDEYPGRNGASTKAAANALIAACYRMGIYDPDRVRGRGAWLDENRAVLHLGDRLLVDGRVMPLDLPQSRFVYEASQPLALRASSAPLSTPDAHKLVKLCGRFSWERPVFGTLLAGWLVIAPVCGALAWRPTIWITGSTSSGKSTLLKQVVSPVLGGVALAVQSKTSEAGIRQALGSDARPVMFDEAEGEDEEAKRRMQGVLDLVRQSSSEGGAEIIKGSAQHGAKRFRVRSCFLFSSINVGLEHNADENRVTVLGLAKPRLSAAEFGALQRDVAALLTPGYVAGLLARSVGMLATIRANAEIFAVAVAAHLGSRRAGDQLGALLAGAYALHSTKQVTRDEAAAFVARHEWDESGAADTNKTDEARLLAHLMQHRVRVSGNRETTLGLLIEAAHDPNGGVIPRPDADNTLRTFGIRYQPHEPETERRQKQDAGFYVANQHPDLTTALRGTPWSAGWHHTLIRLPDATNADNQAKRFGPGVVSKAVFVPMTALGKDDEEEGAKPNEPG